MNTRQPVTPRKVAAAVALLTRDGRPPSVRELSALLRASTSTVARYLGMARDQGLLRTIDDVPGTHRRYCALGRCRGCGRPLP